MAHKKKHLGVMMIVGVMPRTAAPLFTAMLLKAKVCRWSLVVVVVVVMLL